MNNSIMKSQLLILSAFIFPRILLAQTDSLVVSIWVFDAFTNEIVEDCEVDLLAPDSTFIRKGILWYSTDNGVRTGAIAEAKVAKSGTYILRISHKDYFTEYKPFKARIYKHRHLSYDIPGDVRMHRKQGRKTSDGVTLGEAVVKATKIKMVMKDDTIVYNADAFQLSQGSMLDALIERLPGAELKADGVITVNGKPVSNLLVNGRDFFRGDPRIALENLPAYMVDKVKVYEEATIAEKMTGVKDAHRPLVMDVNLKRQYSVGWIANAEAAYGTEDRYLGRLFAMLFSKTSRFALFGNANNTNDTRRPGQRGEWSPSYLPDGDQKSQSVGAEYSYENRQKTFDWTSNIDFTHTDNRVLTNTSSESFLPENRAFAMSRDDSRYRNTSISTSHRFKGHSAGYTYHHEGSARFSYDKSNYLWQTLSGEFSGDPYGVVTQGVLDSLFLPDAGTLGKLARYRRSLDARSNGKNWSLNVPYEIWFTPFKKFGIRDMVTFELSGTYDRHTSHAYDNYRLEYLNADGTPDDYRNRYSTRPSHHYNYMAKVQYSLAPFRRVNINNYFSYGFTRDYRRGRYDLFRLDWLEGWGADADRPMGTLPSSASEIQQALDIRNSEHSERWLNSHQVEWNFRYQTKGKDTGKDLTHTVWLNLPIRIDQEHLIYDRGGHYDLHRNKALVLPGAKWQMIFANETDDIDIWNIFDLAYDLSQQQPDLVQTIDVVNDVNPLYIQHGNADLRTSVTHNLSLELSQLRNFKEMYKFTMSYHRTHNALAMERTYNPVTGGYTVRPVNVNGNWNTDGSLLFNRQFGKQKQFSWGSNTSFSFDHNVDMANVEGTVANGLSTVRNLYLREQFSLDFSQNGWNVGAKVRGSYNRLTGNRSDFTDINAWDYSYGINARIPLPWGIGLNTDFNIYSRRGYGDPSLNTDDFVWNVRLERSILNGNLTFAVDGFDLLKDLSKVTRIVNAQGRTESYTNVLPSYFMAHVIYRLNIQPKKDRKK